MGELRWILLLAGLALIAAIYLWGAWSQRKSACAADAPRDSASARPADMSGPAAEDNAQAALAQDLAGDNVLIESGRDAPPPEARLVAEAATRPPVRASDVDTMAQGERGIEDGLPAQAGGEEKIIVLHVTARQGETFHGADVLRAAETAGLGYGAMRVFHRYAQDRAGDRPVFSVANMVEPGWFERETMEQMTTPGLSLFIRLPGPVNGLAAFDEMLACARQLAQTLGGEMLDERRSAWSRQTEVHTREQIQEYLRRRRLAVKQAH